MSMNGNRRKKYQPDDREQIILQWLDRNQKTKSVWYSPSSIADAIGFSKNDTIKAMWNLMAMGFLWCRHEPGNSDRLLYRLRREGDEK